MIEVRKLDIVVANGMNSETRIIDIKAVTMKLSEKIRRYQDLALELKWVWSKGYLYRGWSVRDLVQNSGLDGPDWSRHKNTH